MRCVLVCAFSCLALPAYSATAAVRYEVSLKNRAEGLATVTLEIDKAPSPTTLRFASWLPGAYELRVFARDVRGMDARDREDRRVAVRRDGASDFVLEGHGEGAALRVTYQIGASLLSDDGADLNDTHAYFNPAALLPRVVGLADQSASLAITNLPLGWQIYNALVAPQAESWSAASYDLLVDAPVEIAPASRVTTGERHVGSARVAVVLHDEASAHAAPLPGKLLDDLARIVATERALAGPLPFSRYLFVIHLSDRLGRNVALEHASSASLVTSRTDLATDEGYLALLHMIAHEVFHAWNARRLVPRAVGSGALESSPALWITEGLTECAAVMAERRLGLLGNERLARIWSDALSRARSVERAELSLEDLSLLAASPPTSLAADPDAYYAAGHVTFLALVGELLHRSKGKVGLEELLAALLPPIGSPPRVIDTDTLGRIVDALVPSTGPSLSSELTLWVRSPFTVSRVVFPFERLGMKIRYWELTRTDTDAIIDDETRVVRMLPPGGAFFRAGARPGDVLTGIDGSLPTVTSLKRLVSGMGQSRPVAITVDRAGLALSLELRPQALSSAVSVVSWGQGGPAAAQRGRLLGDKVP